MGENGFEAFVKRQATNGSGDSPTAREREPGSNVRTLVRRLKPAASPDLMEVGAARATPARKNRASRDGGPKRWRGDAQANLRVPVNAASLRDWRRNVA